MPGVHFHKQETHIDKLFSKLDRIVSSLTPPTNISEESLIHIWKSTK